ncbi:4-hydroxy-tetrahydrodipicolinate synthase [Verrucomicrobia bacterium]|nr:4-hydroxy-tetrahydrodipicolinate synthase [Verrucomicrobiota bacterium]
MFTGTYTAIVTPFKKGNLDEAALTRLVKAQIKGGVDGVVPVGTTGESPTVNVDEHVRVIEIAVQAAAGKVKVVAGSGANCTAEAIHLTQAAEAAGADGSLQVCPYYNKPSQDGLFQHYQAVAKNTGLPIMLYSIPGRSVISIEVQTVVKLAAKCKNIVAIKEAGGSADRVSQLRQALPKDFSILSGDDAQTLPFMSVGATGLVSVASNVAPKLVSQMVRAMAAGNLKKARALHEKLYDLFKVLFIETSPGPVKAGLNLMGLCDEEFRLPLTKVSKKTKDSVRKVLLDLGLLK